MQLAQINPSRNQNANFITDWNSQSIPDKEDLVLVGIQLELRSKEDYAKCYEKIRTVLGPHFKSYFHYDTSKTCIVVRIFPQEYCKVDGGMMFTTAGSILGDLMSKGMQIISMNPLFDK